MKQLPLLLVLAGGCATGQTYSSLVYPGPDGKLVYSGYANEGQISTGNRMIDFSHAGYMGGGIAIPWVPVAVSLDPLPGGEDDHTRIQEAIDLVASMPLSSAGFRGAVLLRAGKYNVSETIRITASGIVIRGEGQHAGGTVINFTATEQDTLFEFEGSAGWTGYSALNEITDTIVPSGVNSFRVESTAYYKVGDRLMVLRTPDQNWIDLLDMAQWGWTASGYKSWSPRRITEINGNMLTLDAPLVHAIESQYGGGQVYLYHFDGAIRQVGIERIRLESEYISETDENHGWDAVKFIKAENAWARQVTASHFGYSCINISNRCQYLTIEDCAQLDPKSIITGGRRYSFNIDDSSFILVQRCYTRRGRHDFATHSRTTGPTAFVDGLAEIAYSDIGPHHRYAEGILFDNIKGWEINVQNRESSGTGHGWAGSQIVFWNCQADSIICDAPKAAMNFAIGCIGSHKQGRWAPYEPDAFWESHQLPVTPRSLYYKQLEDRLGLNPVLTVTTPQQRQGLIWQDLADWHGDSEAPGLSEFEPVQVELAEHEFALLEANHKLEAAVRYPLPQNFPVNSSGWSVVSGPGTVTFHDQADKSTIAVFHGAGRYQLQYSIEQNDNRDPLNVQSYEGVDSMTVQVTATDLYPNGLKIVIGDWTWNLNMGWLYGLHSGWVYSSTIGYFYHIDNFWMYPHNQDNLQIIQIDGQGWGYSFTLEKWLYLSASGWVYIV